MKLDVRVLRNPHADMPELQYRAYANIPNEPLGLIDSSGPTEECALANARRRCLLRYLGVEWPGIATPDDALDPRSG